MLLANIVMAIAAAAAVVVTYIAWRAAEHIGRVQIFLELRRSYIEVASRLDPHYHDDEWTPVADSTAKRGLEGYWLHVVTEWYSTTKLNHGKYTDLWCDFYAKAIQGALRNKALRIALCDMNSSFSGHREEFLREIYRLCPEAHQVELGTCKAFQEALYNRSEENIMSNERFIRWQGNTVAQLSATLSLLSGLAIAGTGFLFSLLSEREFTPAGLYAFLFLVALAAFFTASIAGIAAFVTRLLDFRLTANKIRSGSAAREPLAVFGADATAYGRATWRLFWLLLTAMAVAVVCSTLVLSHVYLARVVQAICG